MRPSLLASSFGPLVVAVALAAAFGATRPAMAATATGRFVNDDELHSISIALVAEADLHAQTLSWAQGGFEPLFGLFDLGNGQLLSVDQGGLHTCAAGPGKPDPITGFCWDASIDAHLGPGHYALVLSQAGNAPAGDVLPGQTLAQTYGQTGIADFTGIWAGLPGARFVDVTGQVRSNEWAVEYRIDPASAVPEPSAAAMLLSAFALAALRRLPPRARS